MSEVVFMVREDHEGYFIARAVGESIFTQGETIEDLREQVREAVRCHFDECDWPRTIRLRFVRDEVIPA